MKKSFFVVFFTFAAFIGAYHFSQLQERGNLSKITMANISALADWDIPDPNQPTKFGTLYESNKGNFCCCPGTRICGASDCGDGVCPESN